MEDDKQHDKNIVEDSDQVSQNEPLRGINTRAMEESVEEITTIREALRKKANKDNPFPNKLRD